MNTQEIKDYFGDRVIYTFSGSLDELADLQSKTTNSYNYIIVAGQIYFVAEKSVDDARASVLE